MFIINPYKFNFTPMKISGLKFWADASKITGLNDDDYVTTWTDASGNSNDVTQATESKKPKYKTNILNSLPVVRFDGSDILSGTLSLKQPHTIFVVGKTNNTSAYHTFVRHSLIILSNVNNAYWGAYGINLVQSSGQTINAFKAITVRARGYNAVDLYTNDSADVTNTDGTAYRSETLALGQWNDTYYLNGDIAEVLLYDNALSSDNVTVVNNYLSKKYNITM